MKSRLFISYSRRQLPFIDRLADQLGKNGYSLWLDYHNLVPAKPWFDQIKSGIADADAVLLIISKDSIASKNVEPEWRCALELRKRVILLIFEAVPLPSELQSCEWVDFRSNYRRSLKQLNNLLDRPAAAVTSTPPQAGFKAPRRLWLALILSVVVLIGSIPTWWTVFVPFILIPLPWQIYKRNYILTRVFLLLILPVLLAVTAGLIPLEERNIFQGLNTFLKVWSIPTTLASWGLLGILLTPAMQRRARPEAAFPRFANPLAVNVQHPRSVLFTIDYAIEDGRCAEELRRALERQGHKTAQPGEIPEAIFVLISTYKKDTQYDPDHQVVFPMLLQTVHDVDPKLQRIQWIEFGHGIRNINILAKLLPEPERLLRAFAMAPTGTQQFFPVSVNSMQGFFLIMGVIAGGYYLTSLLSSGAYLFQEGLATQQLQNFFVGAINVLLMFGVIMLALKGLRSRRGGTSTFYPLVILTTFQVAIIYFTMMIAGFNYYAVDLNPSELLNVMESDGIIGMAFICPLGLLIAIAMMIRWRTLRYRWLPRRHNGSVEGLENLLLLYTPLHQRALVFHVIFHVMLLTFYVLFMLASYGFYNWSIFRYLLPIFLILLWGIRWLARRIST